MYSYIHEEEDHMFQLVDTNKPQKPRSRPRIGVSLHAANVWCVLRQRIIIIRWFITCPATGLQALLG